MKRLKDLLRSFLVVNCDCSVSHLVRTRLSIQFKGGIVTLFYCPNCGGRIIREVELSRKGEE